MKALMLESGGWGGICHYSYNLCQALAKAGADVLLLTAEPYELSDMPHDFTVTSRFAAETSHKTKISRVISTYREYRPDVVHVQSTFSARKDWAVFRLAKLLGIPTVLTAHNVLPHDDEEKNARGMKWAYGKMYHYTHHIIAHSEDSRQTIDQLFAPPPSKMSVIPHGNYVFAESETPLSRQTSRTHLGLDPSARYLLAFGTIRPYKGTEDLLEAFSKIADRFPDVNVLIAGKPIGQDPSELTDLADQLGIANQVIFRPDYIDLDDIAHYFEACDIAVYPYHAIYQSGALQLAYACARPVVATAVGAFPETIDDGQNGRLVEPRSPEKFAEALADLLNAPVEELEAMGKHSRHLADTRYAWSSVADQTIAIYNQLTSR